MIEKFQILYEWQYWNVIISNAWNVVGIEL